MKKIIVACGSGIATSSTVAYKINDMLAKRGYSGRAQADSVDIRAIDKLIKNADIYVSITPVKGAPKYDIPTFSGIPFLTGVGADKVMDEIIKLI